MAVFEGWFILSEGCKDQEGKKSLSLFVRLGILMLILQSSQRLLLLYLSPSRKPTTVSIIWASGSCPAHQGLFHLF